MSQDKPDNWRIIECCAHEILTEAENGRDIGTVSSWTSHLLHVIQDEQRQEEEAPIGAE